MEISTLVSYVKEHNASDVILTPFHAPVIRINGEIHQMRISPLSKEDIDKIITHLLTPEQEEHFHKHFDLDFSIEIDKLRFRANAFVTLNGKSLALRTITETIKDLKELMVPPSVAQFTKLKKGLVIVTGPTGSGKSTTMASMIDYINNNFAKHIITIEDPIEYTFKSNKCLINQREVGAHTNSFASALKSALRENPDIIMLGELRDLETIQLALTAAETGHLVFCTLHTSSAAKTIDRIIDVFPANDKPMIRTMVASSLQGVISQTLLPKQDGTGRVAAYEVMIATSAIRNLLRENKGHQIDSMMQIGVKAGMILMEQSIRNLFETGLISDETAREYINLIKEKDEKKNENSEPVKTITTFKDNEF